MGRDNNSPRIAISLLLKWFQTLNIIIDMSGIPIRNTKLLITNVYINKTIVRILTIIHDK